jgi:hypothetical protein
LRYHERGIYETFKNQEVPLSMVVTQ